MDSRKQTLRERLDPLGLTMSTRWVGEVEETTSTGRVFGDAWRCVIQRPDGRAMSLRFTMGSAYRQRPPTLEEVMEAVLDDARSYKQADGRFEDWAGEFGYDTDSRRAEATFRLVEAQTFRLSFLLGDQFDAFLYETDEEEVSVDGS